MPRIQLLVPVFPSIASDKMSATDFDFLLDPLDTPKQTRQKIGRSFCEPGNIENNFALRLAEYIFLITNNGKMFKSIKVIFIFFHEQ